MEELPGDGPLAAALGSGILRRLALSTSQSLTLGLGDLLDVGPELVHVPHVGAVQLLGQLPDQPEVLEHRERIQHRAGGGGRGRDGVHRPLQGTAPLRGFRFQNRRSDK